MPGPPTQPGPSGSTGTPPVAGRLHTVPLLPATRARPASTPGAANPIIIPGRPALPSVRKSAGYTTRVRWQVAPQAGQYQDRL